MKNRNSYFLVLWAKGQKPRLFIVLFLYKLHKKRNRTNNGLWNEYIVYRRFLRRGSIWETSINDVMIKGKGGW